MRWLKSLFGKREAVQIAEEQAKQEAAFKLGQDAARSMVAELDGFIASRFGHIKEAYLEILAKGFRGALSQIEHSPILMARAELAVFIDNIASTRETMTAEIAEHMCEWEEAFERVGERDQVARVINARLDDLGLDLRTGGIDMLVKHADTLKIADDSWRRKYPELAAQEPLEP